MSKQKSKPGFGGQWVEAFGVGRQVGLTADGKRKEINVTPELLDQIASNYDVALHEAPATIGHPADDAPAYGWISGARVTGDKLELQFADLDPGFEQMVRDGRFKKRSLRLYIDPQGAPGGKAPNIRHCAFLGAEPPAVKGLKNIHFSEDEGESIAFDVEGDINFSEGATMNDDDVKKTIRESLVDFFKTLGGAKSERTEGVNFSETDLRGMIDTAVAKVKTDMTVTFSEEIATLKTENEALKKKVDQQVGHSKRGEILQFCESLGANKLPPAFKNMGLVEFMESLAASDEKVSVISFSEEDGKQIEKATEVAPLDWFKNFLSALPAYVQFGEKFGGLTVAAAEGDGSEYVDPKRMDALRESAGIKKEAKA